MSKFIMDKDPFSDTFVLDQGSKKSALVNQPPPINKPLNRHVYKDSRYCDKVKTNLQVDPDLYIELKSVCALRGVRMYEATEEGWRYVIEKYNKEMKDLNHS